MIKINYEITEEVKEIYKDISVDTVEELNAISEYRLYNLKKGETVIEINEDTLYQFLTARDFYKYEIIIVEKKEVEDTDELFTSVKNLENINKTLTLKTILSKPQHYKDDKTKDLLENFQSIYQDDKRCEKDKIDRYIRQYHKNYLAEKSIGAPYYMFDYSKIEGERRHQILTSMDISVCPYCNRNYISSYNVQGKLKTTADADHFYLKSDRKDYAICLYNLIPSCTICNSRLKATEKMNVEDYIFPHEESFEGKCNFKVDNMIEVITQGKESSIILDVIELDNHKMVKKVKESKDLFKLEPLYKNHSKVTDELIKKAIVYNNSYKEELASSYEELFSLIDMKQLIFGAELTEEDFKDTSLGKLKRDILKQLEIY